MNKWSWSFPQWVAVSKLIQHWCTLGCRVMYVAYGLQWHWFMETYSPASKYMFKVNNESTRARCEIRSKLTIKTPERRDWRRSSIFIVNFEQVNTGWEVADIKIDYIQLQQDIWELAQGKWGDFSAPYMTDKIYEHRM